MQFTRRKLVLTNRPLRFRLVTEGEAILSIHQEDMMMQNESHECKMQL